MSDTDNLTADTSDNQAGNKPAITQQVATRTIQVAY